MEAEERWNQEEIETQERCIEEEIKAQERWNQEEMEVEEIRIEIEQRNV